MPTHRDVEMERDGVAREEFIAAYCFWWPSTYKMLLPVTSDGRTLARAKAQIEAMMAADFAAYQKEQASPWLVRGPEPHMIDWSTLKGAELAAFWGYPNTNADIAVLAANLHIAGYPHRVKPGREADVPQEIQEAAVAIGKDRAARAEKLMAEQRRLSDELQTTQDAARIKEINAAFAEVSAELQAMGKGE